MATGAISLPRQETIDPQASRSRRSSDPQTWRNTSNGKSFRRGVEDSTNCVVFNAPPWLTCLPHKPPSAFCSAWPIPVLRFARKYFQRTSTCDGSLTAPSCCHARTMRRSAGAQPTESGIVSLQSFVCVRPPYLSLAGRCSAHVSRLAAR